MSSCILVGKPPLAKAAAKPAPQSKPAHQYFATEEIVASTSSAPSYNLAGLSIFAPGEGGAPGPPTRRAPMPPPWPIQAKLAVGAVDDPLEREADHVAERVMRMPDPVAAASPVVSGAVSRVQRKCACGGSCENCQAAQSSPSSDDGQGQVQRKPAAAAVGLGHGAVGHGLTSLTAPPIVHEVLRSPGQPLDAATRAFMEPRLGHDFSRVRVHTDARAAQSARTMNSLAYTVEHNIVFGVGRFNPKGSEGRQLLAHELTHVVQQTDLGLPTMLGSARGSTGREVALGVPGGTVQRQSDKKDIKPPDMRESIRHQIETALGTVGLVASAVSILEVAAPRTVEAAGVGTTLGGLLLIPGAFLIGTTIREDQDRREAALNDFMIKLYASVVSDALERALDKLNGKGPKLNEGGRRAVSKIDLSLRDQMSHDISYQLFLDSQMHIYSGDSWQALYEKWMNGYAEDLYKIYSDPKNVDSPADNRGGTVGARKLFWPL